MSIEIINTGSELMLGHVLNTHQQWLCRELSDRGYVVARQTSVSDAGADIQSAVREAMARARVIIATGGLGPTSDDRTREVVAELLGRPLREDAETWARIQAFFAKRKRPVPPSTRVQALVPEGAVILQNEFGTAPGLMLDFAKGILFLLPGPPRELRPMFSDQVLPLLEKHFGAPRGFACSVLKSSGIGESILEEKVGPVLKPLIERGLEVGFCARVGEVDLRLAARCPDADVLVREAEALARDSLREFIYGKEPDSLEAVVVRLLAGHRKTVALAESCTGGYIANCLTNVPGASNVFLAGIVSYSNQAKTTFLGVPAELIETQGAVSEPVAREMARGVRARTEADFALAVTGIAGPGGGTPDKPVGTVFIALADANSVTVRKMFHPYDRETFKFVTARQALDLLRRAVIAASA